MAYEKDQFWMFDWLKTEKIRIVFVGRVFCFWLFLFLFLLESELLLSRCYCFNTVNETLALQPF